MPRPESKPWAYAIAFLGCIATAIFRIVPHPANFTPMGAVGLFSGAKLDGWRRFAFPIGIMMLSDVLLYFCSGFNERYSLTHVSRAYVYFSIVVYVWLGHFVAIRGGAWILAASLLGSLQFYLITNAFDWLFQPLQSGVFQPYTRDLGGFLHCMAAGLPFYEGQFLCDPYAFFVTLNPGYGVYGTFLGDLLFSCVLFTLYAWAARSQPAAQPASDILVERT